MSRTTHNRRTMRQAKEEGAHYPLEDLTRHREELAAARDRANAMALANEEGDSHYWLLDFREEG